MNYDNLHTTAEILEAFQGCRDVGEEIDLFEALAWRDEPPVEAFVEIIRKIKLEPVLALATQALGWVKNTEILEQFKKSEELLELLSGLAISGSTVLIQWSAAKSIILIDFDFSSIAQHLNEMPQSIVDKIYSNPRYLLFWRYSGIAIFNDILVEKDVKSDAGRSLKAFILLDILSAKGIRGIREMNFYFRKSIVENGNSNVLEFACACQKISEMLLSKLLGVYAPDDRTKQNIEILVSNQIYCLSSNLRTVQGAALMFFVNTHLPPYLLDSGGLRSALDRIEEIMRKIENTLEDFPKNTLKELVYPEDKLRDSEYPRNLGHPIRNADNDLISGIPRDKLNMVKIIKSKVLQGNSTSKANDVIHEIENQLENLKEVYILMH
jgi:hypothetical protein